MGFLRIAGAALAASFLCGLPASAQSTGDWNATVAAAKQEGALTISAPSGREWRDQLLEFQKAYPEIKVSATEFASRDFWPRILKEREAGQYLWDFRIGGPDVASYNIKNQGLMAPIRPLLALPEVTDPSKWMGGIDGLFADKEKQYFLAFTAYESENVYYNRTIIPSLTMKELIDPRWKGKISLADPRGGAALVTLGVLQMTYGDGFIKTLVADQQPVGELVGAADAQIPEILAGLALLQKTRPEIAPGHRGDRQLDRRIGLLEFLQLLAPGAPRRPRDGERPLLLGRRDEIIPAGRLLLRERGKREERENNGERAHERHRQPRSFPPSCFRHGRA